MMKKLLFLLLTSLILISCASSVKLLQEGHYDNAIEKAIKKIRKDPSNRQETGVLRKALKLANKSDMEAIEQLKLSGQPAIYESVYHHYVHLNQRQEMISRLPDGILYKIDFSPVNYIPEIALAKRKTADYFDAKGVSLLNKGDRYNARSAWEYFQKEAQLFPETPGLNNKIYSALQQGMSRILFKIQNKSHQGLPKDFEKELKTIDLRELNNQWIQISTQFPENQPVDYIVVLNIRNISVTPELIDRHSHKEQKTFDDGWNYVLDKRGNVKKDSTGNDIKVKKYRTIHCQITDIHLSKSAQVTGTLDFFDNSSRKLIKSRPISSQFAFDYHYATAKGNLKAVSDETQRLLRREPLPFPPDLQMIFDTSQELKKIALGNIREDIRFFQ